MLMSHEIMSKKSCGEDGVHLVNMFEKFII